MALQQQHVSTGWCILKDWPHVTHALPSFVLGTLQELVSHVEGRVYAAGFLTYLSPIQAAILPAFLR